MSDYGEPWETQDHHSNIYDTNGDCIATVFNHRERIVACVNACKGIDPITVPYTVSVADVGYLVSRLRRVVELLRDPGSHSRYMAIAKLLADISALSEEANDRASN